jgi:DNA-binding IclR family transcriptional regulator
MTTVPTDLIRSVSRALRVLEQVTQASRPLPVKVIARRCGLSLSTTYHLTRTLCYEGYLLRQADGTYAPGSQVAERFHELVGSFRRPPGAAAVLRHLASVSGHTAYLARFVGERFAVAAVAEGPRSPWLEELQVGLDTAAHATALGKALLTTLPRGDARRLLASWGLRPFTRRTPTDATALESELRLLSPGDVVVEHGEFRDDVACASIATPADEPGGWWALGVSTRGLDLPGPLVAHLRDASYDLGVRTGRPSGHEDPAAGQAPVLQVVHGAVHLGQRVGPGT